jgi:Glycosyl hydrolase family 47
MKFAFPQDELDPIKCKGRSRDSNKDNWAVNDVLGNFSLTLIDSLDMFVIVGDKKGFERAVADTIAVVPYDFNVDSRVQYW